MDKLIVRLSAILVNIYMAIVLIFALSGIDISIYDYWFSTSMLFGLVLSVLAHSQGKYHCKWMRGLCYTSISVPAVGYVDAMYGIFGNAMDFIIAIACIWTLGILYTLFEAMRHFIKIRCIIRKKHGKDRAFK